MNYKDKIRSLDDLIEYGFLSGGYEDDNSLYIWTDDPNRNQYDSSLYIFDKKTKNLERESSIVGVIADISNAKEMTFSSEYLKQYL